MKYRIICMVEVENARSEDHAKFKIRCASAYENHFGVKIEPIDLSNLRKKNGTKDTSPPDPMPELRQKIRRIQR